jgi:hypothetical protein
MSDGGWRIRVLKKKGLFLEYDCRDTADDGIRSFADSRSIWPAFNNVTYSWKSCYMILTPWYCHHGPVWTQRGWGPQPVANTRKSLCGLDDMCGFSGAENDQFAVTPPSSDIGVGGATRGVTLGDALALHAAIENAIPVPEATEFDHAPCYQPTGGHRKREPQGRLFKVARAASYGACSITRSHMA